MEIKLKTLTPIWTGGAEAGKMDRIHETGIIGSMRWWYEAIVRGLGGSACDPSKHSCPDKDGHLCDACAVFGTTGWKRRFGMRIADDTTQPVWESADKILNIRPQGRTRGWYLPPGRMGEFSLLFHGDQKTLSIIAALFLFLEKWGNLGAKFQLGYGVFSLDNECREAVNEIAKKWCWDAIDENKPVSHERPDLRRFCFVSYEFKPESHDWWKKVPGISMVESQIKSIVKAHSVVPVSPAMKNGWRFEKGLDNPHDEKWMFGSLKYKIGKEMVPVRSKVTTTWAYMQNKNWMVRAWAWLQQPKTANAVRDIMQDSKTWKKIIGVEGKLEIALKKTRQEWSITDITQFLEGTKK